MQQILFLQVGGTIDKDYPQDDDHHGYSFEIGLPAYTRVLERVNPSFGFETRTVLQKDSLDMTDVDRDMVVNACIDNNFSNIVVTHGTDTMIQTAEKLAARVKNKTIVITGAMSPERFKDSDADFNIGVASGAVGLLDNGVYIAMNGEIFKWNEVVFDKSLNRFTAKDKP